MAIYMCRSYYKKNEWTPNLKPVNFPVYSTFLNEDWKFVCMKQL